MPGRSGDFIGPVEGERRPLATDRGIVNAYIPFTQSEDYSHYRHDVHELLIGRLSELKFNDRWAGRRFGVHNLADAEEVLELAEDEENAGDLEWS